MDSYIFDNLKIYKSVYEYIDSNMYLMIDKDTAIIIDPHKNNEIFSMLKKENISELYILLTHEHPDHISGIPFYKENFNTKIICTDTCAKIISDEKTTRPLLITFVLGEKDRLNNTNLSEEFKKSYKPFSVKADYTFEDEYVFQIKSNTFKFKKVLGHSKGSSIITINDKVIFTGDTLMIDNPVITRFLGGSKKEFYSKTIPYFKTLNKNMIVLPGHGKIFLLKDLYKNDELLVGIR